MADGLAAWRYPHRDLGEHPFPDGALVRRLVVVVAPARSVRRYLAVVDSGSPITIADSEFIRSCGVDPDGEGLMTLPLQMGGQFDSVRVFEIELDLIPASGDEPPLRWTAKFAGRPRWKLPFAVLLGQRGWFDRFPTRIDAAHTTVQIAR